MAHRVLLGQFMHETNTFCERKTGESAFRTFYCHEGADVLTALVGTANEIGGFIDVGHARGWALVPTVATFATPGGVVTDAAWNTFAGHILSTARNEGPFDGILLSLHGAMVREDGSDGDAGLVRALRHIIGPDVQMAVTLDLHANLSPEMSKDANVIISYKTFPHVDMRETGKKAAEALSRAMDGRGSFKTIVRKLPMMSLPEGGRTDSEPMLSLQRLAEELEACDRTILDISINAGFSLADVPEIGPSVTVCHQNTPEFAARAADIVAKAIWEARDAPGEDVLTPATAAQLAAAHRGDRPLVLADISDNPGEGAYGDATDLLAALLRSGGSEILYGALCDPDAVSVAIRAGVGAMVMLALGGRFAPDFGGGPLDVEAQVLALGDGRYICDSPMWNGVAQSCGPSALLRIGGTDVLVCSVATQALDMAMFRAIGAAPLTKRVVALKSTQHFRAAFGPVADRIVLIDGGGLASPRLDRLQYKRIPRPIHPLEQMKPDG